MASKVPKWSATSKAWLGSSMGTNCGTRIRCAVLLTGMNSVRPWTTPRSSECCRFNLQVLYARLSTETPRLAALHAAQAHEVALLGPNHIIVDQDLDDRRDRDSEEHADQPEELRADQQHNDNYGRVQADLVADQLRHQDLA